MSAPHPGVGVDPELRRALLLARRGMILAVDAIEALLQVGRHEPRERSLAPPVDRQEKRHQGAECNARPEEPGV